MSRTVKTFLLLLSGALALPLQVDADAVTGAAKLQHRAVTRASTGACPACTLLGIERRALTPTVAEYSLDLRVGPGEHDVIGLHRVVRELSPFVPAPTSRAVFMAHGDVWDFDAAFLSNGASPSTPDDRALPVFLADRGVDVWGIDFRWTRVPLETSDLSFMGDWSVDTDAGDLGKALAIARLTRALTGDGFGKLHLLGWSRGGIVSYAYLSAETRLPSFLRQVAGFIPVDIYLKVDDPDLRQAACDRYAAAQARLDAGEVAEGIGAAVAAEGDLALRDPGGASALFPGLTHEQAGLLIGAATFLLADPVPHYHFTGGTFGADGLPDGLLYTEPELFFEFLSAGSPWQPLRALAESDAAICDGPGAPDVPWDDHLDEISVPVLYVGAAGGFGATGVFTTSLLASTDVTVRVVSVQPPELVISDFGHGDLFQAASAEALVWTPILDWLETH